MKNNISKSSGLVSRPPIVAVLGHVDHGKTTLLDFIRKTHFAQKEVGGITQSIGASFVTTKEGKNITFIDTPGHAAFSDMRARGAKAADIAILVVASDDGVKPQTREALKFIREAEVPFIVAATKSDLPSASPEKVKGDLEKEQVLFEGRGGDVPLVPVSGKTGKGIDELMDMIILVSELANTKGSESNPLEATVIETGRDKKGPVATVVVRDGKLKVADELISDTTEAKVKGLFDWMGSKISEVLPGQPALILGFSELPEIGSPLWKKTERYVEIRQRIQKPLVKLEEIEGQFPIVLKASNTGALEAVLAGLKDKVLVVSSGVGDVNESDVFLAKSANAHIYAFESKASSNVKRLAQTEGVHIDSFRIIYELFERIDIEFRKGIQEVFGKARITDVFPFEGKRVAGCKVLEGKIQKSVVAKLIREEKELGEIRIVSMRKGKDEIEEAKQGEECGILFSPQLDFKIGDDILSVRKAISSKL